MKKLILPAIAAATLLAVSTSAFAQGQVGFLNTATTKVVLLNSTTQVSQNMNGPAGTYQFGLYVGHVGDAAGSLSLVGTTLSPAAASSTIFNSGLFNGGNPFTLPTLAGQYDGSIALEFQIRGWSAALGSSYEAAIGNTAAANYANSYFGVSALGTVTPVLPPNTVPGLFGTGAGQIGGFILATPAPEPGTLALAGIGAASLLLFRRRK